MRQRSREQVIGACLAFLVTSIIVCTLDRTPRLWRGVSDIRVAQPEPYFDPRLPDRAAMDAIFFVLRTGCQWNALRETTICSSSSAHRRFQEWVAAGVFAALWRKGLLAYDALWGIDWTWLSLDGAMGKAPLGG